MDGGLPGLLLLAPCLEGIDRRGVFEGQADIVKTVEQAALAECVDLEMNLAAILADDGLGFNVDGEAGIGAEPGIFYQLLADFLRKDDRQNAVLEAVTVKNIGEAGCDDAVMPKSSSAQGACSRDEPQPKFSPATRMLAPRYLGWFSTNSGFSDPFSLLRSESKRCTPRPLRLMVLRKREGMILSVSTLAMFSGAATAVRVVKASIMQAL